MNIFGIVFTVVVAPCEVCSCSLVELNAFDIRSNCKLIPFTHTGTWARITHLGNDVPLEFGIGMTKNRLANRIHLLRFCGTFQRWAFFVCRIWIVIAAAFFSLSLSHHCFVDGIQCMCSNVCSFCFCFYFVLQLNSFVGIAIIVAVTIAIVALSLRRLLFPFACVWCFSLEPELIFAVQLLHVHHYLFKDLSNIKPNLVSDADAV